MSDKNLSVGEIGRGPRAALLTVGVASWVSGAVATFIASNAVSSAVLIAAGAAAGGIGLMGRWPEKISISGNEVAWSKYREVVDDQIEVAESTSSDPRVVQELLSLRTRLEQLHATGRASEHPANVYDTQVEAALLRVQPSARLRRSAERSKRVADFVMQTRRGEVSVETKWRPDPASPFQGSTLTSLFSGLGSRDRLLVITNTRNLDVVRARITAEMGQRGRAVTWQNERDDDALKAAIDSLIAHGS